MPRVALPPSNMPREPFPAIGDRGGQAKSHRGVTLLTLPLRSRGPQQESCYRRSVHSLQSVRAARIQSCALSGFTGSVRQQLANQPTYILMRKSPMQIPHPRFRVATIRSHACRFKQTPGGVGFVCLLSRCREGRGVSAPTSIDILRPDQPISRSHHGFPVSRSNSATPAATLLGSVQC